MGFSGGGSNITKAHTHSSAIVQDGGALDFDDVTQAGGAAGQITYSDGSALQLLDIGSASDLLQVNGAGLAPEWVAPAAGGVTTNIQTQSSNVADSTTSLTFVDTIFTKTLAGTGAGTCNTVYNYVIENTNNYALRWSYSTDGDEAEFRPLGQINYPNGNCYSANTTTLGSQVCKVQMRMTAAGTITLQPYSSVYFQSTAYWTEIS